MEDWQRKQHRKSMDDYMDQSFVPQNFLKPTVPQPKVKSSVKQSSRVTKTTL